MDIIDRSIPRLCTPEFRETCRQTYPGLDTPTKHGHGRFHWSMLEYCIYGHGFDKHHPDRLLAEYRFILYLAGISSNTHDHISAIRLMELFEEATGIDLDIQPHSEGKCRTIKPNIDPAILEALKEDVAVRAQPGYDKTTLVYFDSGTFFVESRHKKAIKEWRNRIADLVDDNPEHPAHGLMALLVDGGDYVKRFIESRFPLIHNAIMRLSGEGDVDYNHRILANILTNPYTAYKNVPQSVRLYPANASPLCMTREVRKAAFSGCYELDIKSSQLAIMAMLCDLPKINKFLQSGKSIWTEFYNYLDVDSSVKDVLKDALYATQYGQGVSKTIENLAAVIGTEKADRFMKHPLIKELVKGIKDNLHEGFEYQPIPVGTLVQIKKFIDSSHEGAEYWIMGYVNGIDGVCE